MIAVENNINVLEFNWKSYCNSTIRDIIFAVLWVTYSPGQLDPQNFESNHIGSYVLRKEHNL